MDLDVGGADVVEVAARVEFQVGADGDPEVAPPPARPGLGDEPGDRAALADARAVAEEEAGGLARGEAGRSNINWIMDLLNNMSFA